MRVALTGAAGTGKTTLALQLADAYGWLVNPVGARSVAKEMGLATPYQADVTGRRQEFQEKLVKSKYDWERTHDDFITDRSAADNWVYSKLHCGRPDGLLYYSTEYWRELHETQLNYDLVLLLPLKAYWNCDGDPARRDELDYHVNYEQELLAWLNRNEYPYVVLNEGLATRFQAARQILQTQLGLP